MTALGKGGRKASLPQRFCILLKGMYACRIHHRRSAILGKRFEGGVLRQESQFYGPDAPVAVLADDKFRDAFFRRIGLVYLVAVKEDHDVRILFNGSGFTQVREHGAVVFTFFNFTVELRKGHDRYVELFGYSLERAGDIRNFEFTGVRAP